MYIMKIVLKTICSLNHTAINSYNCIYIIKWTLQITTLWFPAFNMIKLYY